MNDLHEHDYPHAALRPLDRRRSRLGHYAGFATRAMSFALDVIIISVVVVFTTWFVSTSLYMLQIPQILEQISSRMPTMHTLIVFIFGPLVGSILTFTFIIGYYIFFWMLAGQTPGKNIMGLRIVSIDGGRLTLRHVIMRYIGYYISALPLGLGFLWVLVDDQRRTWHDRFSRTCVIYSWDARPDENFLVHTMMELSARRRRMAELIRRPRPK